MTLSQIKLNLHSLIDSIDNEHTLKLIYDLVVNKQALEEGNVWNELTEDQVKELMQAADEADRGENLLPHSEVKKHIAKWL